VAPLSRSLELLESAVAYTLGVAVLGTPELMRRPTPCPGWDLETLLGHVTDSIAVLHDAIGGGGIASAAASERRVPHTEEPWLDPVVRLHHEATGLLSAFAVAGPAERRIAIWDRDLSQGMVAVTGAMEIAVHGWDISIACGAQQPVPSGLAAVLLPIAPLLVTPATRPGLFADAVPLFGPACPGDQLVAFLGRSPRNTVPLGIGG